MYQYAFICVCVLLRNKINAFCRKIKLSCYAHYCMDDLKNQHIFHSQTTWEIDVLGLFFRHVIHGYFFTIRHRHTSVRSLQDLNVCTVNPQLDFIIIDDILKYTYVPKLFLIH